MSNETQQNETQEEQKYDSDDPETWREVEDNVAENNAATVDLEALGKMTPSQIQALKKIRATILDGRHESFRVHEFTVELLENGKLWVQIRATRTDCDRYSPRAIFCEEQGTFKIGRGGKIEVRTVGLRDDITKRDLKKHPMIYGFRSGV